MLTREEFELILPEVADYLSDQVDLRALISIMFAPDHSPILQELPTNLTRIADQALWLLDYCRMSRWSRNPSLMERLLDRLVSQGGKGGLAPLRNRVRNGVDPNPNLFQSQWILANQPFFDRAGVRAKAQQLVEKAARPILRVNGPKGSGKSYSSELLAYVAEEGPGHLHVSTATLEDGNGPSFTATELAETLVLSMTPDEQIPERSTSSYPAALCRWIIRCALRRVGVWVLVLDGFGQKDVQPEVRQLVQNLATQILAPEIAKRVRLVLIDYEYDDDGHTNNWRAKMLEDKLPNPAALTHADLMTCLAAHNLRVQSQGKPWNAIEPADVPTLATALLFRASSDSSKRLRGIYNELLAIAQLGDE